MRLSWIKMSASSGTRECSGGCGWKSTARAAFCSSAVGAVLLLILVHGETAHAWSHAGKNGAASQRLQTRTNRPQRHLAEWLRQHQNMSLDAQVRALRNEPGFDRLAPSVQQRLTDRLRQLNAMPPERRARTLQSMEALERLSPEKRQQVRTAMLEMRALPVDRLRMMHMAFRDLRQLPPEQRTAVLQSPSFKSGFSPQEQHILATVMTVQPYQAPSHPPDAAGPEGKQ